ncbi:type VI secretion system-associated protein TagF [Curvibacter sp. CHRR-16]|uniref:type VI secretion system-associated protein TagF n=1 Tax=Curvibacter sp. CHRR-16 TaxID=2835872 RepID=UPI001BDB0EAD|nr:type VI secretion system-associated protein TagF [Curvibacter sp. CHRR-16]MBT0571846.1 type VI secretion system-associated protein TagF [Curvibacter sp. CHRR-16]
MGQHLIHTLLASPLSVWGKLPSHGDFLRHNVSPEEAHDWQEWAMRAWRNPTDTTGALGGVPVAWVMQPGTLPFAKQHFVVGIALQSEDSMGRECPLLIYQKLSPKWLASLLVNNALGHGQDMLYWLARLVARTHAANADWQNLVQAVDVLGSLYAPSWKNLFFIGPRAVDPAKAQAVLQQYCPSDNLDAARSLHGVTHLPWRNWPERLLRVQSPVSAYWQQDIHGGYVNAAQDLASLWRSRS